MEVHHHPQLMHEKEVARIQYETKLRTDAAAKRKEINATLTELDEQAKKRVKYITLNWKHLYHGFQFDIDSLNFYAKKSIDLINKKYN